MDNLNQMIKQELRDRRKRPDRTVFNASSGVGGTGGMDRTDRSGRMNDYGGRARLGFKSAAEDDTGSTTVSESYHTISDKMPDVPKPSYGQIQRAVVAINRVQKEYERLQSRESGHRVGAFLYYAMDSVTGAVGIPTKPRSGLQLFNAQIGNVSHLNRMLGALIIYGDKERNLIRQRTEEVIDMSCEAHGRMMEYKGKLPGMIDLLKEKKEKLRSSSPSDRDYFDAKKKVLLLERDVNDSYSKFVRSQQRYAGLTEHMNNIELMERLFSTYLNTGAELAVITEQIGQTLEDNHRILSGSEMIAGTAAAVSGSIDVLAEYNRQMNSAFSNGVSKMQSMIYGHENIGMISSTNSSLKQIIDDIESVEFSKNQQLEGYIVNLR